MNSNVENKDTTMTRSNQRVEDLRSWQERIRQIQTEKVDPIMLETIRRKADRSQRAERSKQTAQRLEWGNYLQSKSSAVTLKKLALTSTDRDNSGNSKQKNNFLQSAPVEKRYQDASEQYASRSNAVRSTMKEVIDESDVNMQSDNLLASIQDARLQQLEMQLQEEEEGLDEDYVDLSTNGLKEASKVPPSKPVSSIFSMFYNAPKQPTTQQVMLSSPMGIAASDEEVLISAGTEDVLATTQLSAVQELDQLLLQLATEPTDADELKAKFLLFENFLENVTTIRIQTFKFWEDNKDQFMGSIHAVIEKELHSIDSADAMGIFDEDNSKWFVYFMTVKANQNNRSISQILAGMRARLTLLAQELGECPFCLDQMVSDKCTTLGCCHKVCSDCWEQWLEIKHQQAFCPLCKHPEFVEEVLQFR